ncbi:carboxypeptidase regulatory-like domain-containing protein [Streptomyces gilvus]|uniref:carboxypeptidase regulatory-like domain-containing protein n=1 Tax=Streptomyces gilvus TaxID=2920937 RepID=UPI001F117B70|nr:carboxypeptidase regulatory-like domain-containing protein [Streptomyces sp. CME 23]MCH5674139.1 carboxypeptidase regulatory-like domain-containing protein [Streptomyces sp. CME 23]
MPKLTIRVFLSPRRVNEKKPHRWRDGWPTPSGVVIELTHGDAPRSGKGDEGHGGHRGPITLHASDEHGFLRHENVPPGRYKVGVRHGAGAFCRALVVHGGTDDRHHIEVGEHRPAEAEIVLLPAENQRLFLLHALFESGEPLDGAELKVQGKPFFSGADGAVYAACPDERVTVIPCDHPGARAVARDGTFEADRAGVEGGEPPEYGIDVYYRPAPARLTVTPRLKDTPLSGVVLELTRHDDPDTEPVRRATDSLDTTCVFDDVPAGRYTVAVVDTTAATYGTTRRSVVAVPGQHRANLTVRAGDDLDLSGSFAFELSTTATGTLTGLVTDRAGVPLNGVEIAARQNDRLERAKTHLNGRYTVADLPAGAWTVSLARSPVTVGGRSLVADPPEGVTATVAEQRTNEAPDLVLGEEPHIVFGFVSDENGQPLDFATVEIRSADGGTRLGTTQTDDKGRYEWAAPTAGRFLLSVVSQDGRPVRRFPVEVHSTTRMDITHRVNGSSGPPGPTPPPAPDQNLVDLSTFPVLTEEIGTSGGRAAGSGTADRASSYGQTVEGALRDVLGWRPGSNTSGFQAALAGAFELRDVQGHTEFTWHPRGYAVQADLGALTGAQASIYQRAKNALDQITPLLDGLTPLDPAADPQDTEAVRSIIRAELGELVDELAVEGGPRIQRVDELFVLLLGSRNPGTRLDPDSVGGQLAQLRDRFGLSSARIGTLDEERIVTNFRIVVDHVLALAAGWDKDRDLFAGTTAQTSLGTVLIQLSRSLDVVAQSVEETVFALDSVFVDAAQRQTIQLRFGDATPPTPPILLSDLLDWVVRVSTMEGPRLIQDAGKDGVIAIAPVLDQLARLIRLTTQLVTTPPNQGGDPTLPDGIRTPRVLRALRELGGQLDNASGLASAVQRPEAVEIVFVDAASAGGDGLPATVTVVGRGFVPGSQAVLTAAGRPQFGEFPATRPVVLGPSSRATFTFGFLPSGTPAAPITWLITVVNPGAVRSNTVDALTT